MAETQGNGPYYEENPERVRVNRLTRADIARDDDDKSWGAQTRHGAMAELVEVSESLDQLQKTIMVLQERLSPTLLPEEATPTLRGEDDSPDKPMVSELVEEIQGLRQRVVLQNARLATLTSRVQL